MLARVLDGPGVHHAATAVGESSHGVVVEPLESPGARHQLGVGGHDAGHVLEDLAALGAERVGQRHCGGVAAAAAEGGDLLGLAADALEAGHHHDLARGQGLGQADRTHGEDAGVVVAGVGDDAGLAAGQRHGRHALGREGHA